MRTIISLSFFAAFVSAAPAELNQDQSLDRRNVFERQYLCGTTYCTSSQVCCGYTCCAVGCDPSGIFCSSTPSSCKLTEVPCGSSCCDLLSGYYCGTSGTCVYESPATPTPYVSPNSCYSYQTICGSNCCSSSETCETTSSGLYYCSSGGSSSSSSSSSDSSSDSSSSDSSSSDSSSSDSSSRSSSSRHSSKSSKGGIPPKAIAGVVIGVLVGVGLVISGILYCCCGIGKKKKATEAEPVGQPQVTEEVPPPPPAYVGEPKQMSATVS